MQNKEKEQKNEEPILTSLNRSINKKCIKKEHNLSILHTTSSNGKFNRMKINENQTKHAKIIRLIVIILSSPTNFNF